MTGDLVCVFADSRYLRSLPSDNGLRLFDWNLLELKIPSFCHNSQTSHAAPVLEFAQSSIIPRTTLKVSCVTISALQIADRWLGC